MFDKEAIEQANKKYPVPRVSNELDFARNRKYEEGFRDGAEFGYNKEKERLKELEERTERMMCCGNCIHFNFNEPNYCHKGVYRERLYVCDEWNFGN